MDPFSSVDKQALALTHAIALAETGINGKPDYTNTSGDAGTSKGAYQWQPGNYEAAAKEAGLDPNDFSPANQDKVAYYQVKKYKDQGYTPAQIASLWNSGSPDNYENHSGTTTINGKQIQYDTPAYVSKVKNNYLTLINGTNSSPDASQPPTGASQTPPVSTYSYPTVPTTQDNIAKLKNATNDAKVASQDASEQNSTKGVIKNTLSGIFKSVAGSEIGAGNDIGGGLAASAVAKDLSDADKTTADTKVALIKQIRADKLAGKDTSRLERAYNSVYGKTDPLPSFADIVPSSKKTNLQGLGEAGGIALDTLTAGSYGNEAKGAKSFEFLSKTAAKEGATGTVKGVATAATGIPAAGEVISTASKPSGIATVKGITNVAKGTAIGYGYDVTQGLQGNRGDDRTGAKALIPGAGTIVGAAIPAVTETAQSVLNRFDPGTRSAKLYQQRMDELDKLDGSYKTLKTASDKGITRGLNPKEVIAQTDVLHGAVDNTGTIHTKGEDGAVAQYTKQYIDGNENVVSNVLKKEGNSVPVSTVEKSLNDAVDKSGLEGAELATAKKKISSEIEGLKLRADKDGNIPVETLHKAKINKYNNINFFTDPEKNTYNKSVAGAFKKLVEDNTKSVDVKAINQELSKHYAVIDYLNKLDGKKVEGGRLGKYFSALIGAHVGGMVGGPLGSIAGAEAGARTRGSMLQRVFKGKTGTVLPESEIINNAKDFVNKKPSANLPSVVPQTIELPEKLPRDQATVDAQSSSKSLGSRNISQSTTTTNTIKSNIPESMPAEKGKGNDIFDKDGFRPVGKNEVLPSGYTTKMNVTTGEQLTNAPVKKVGTAGSAKLGAVTDIAKITAGLTGAAVVAKRGSDALGKAFGSGTYKSSSGVPKSPTVKSGTPTVVPAPKLADAIANNETGGEKQPYSFHQPSGNKSLGQALGKYQVTEYELTHKAQQFLGKKVSMKEFLNSPTLQDKFMQGKITWLRSHGLSDAQILAAHRGGYSNFANINATIAKYKPYVDKGLAYLTGNNT